MAQRPPERDELEALLDPLLDFAQQMLGKRGEFYPFGNVLTIDDEVALVSAAGTSDHPPSQEVIDVLVDGMRGQAVAGEIKAVGICYDARIKGADGKATDAIAVSLEHQAGDSVIVFLPYTKGLLGRLKFDELIASPGERRVFVTT